MFLTAEELIELTGRQTRPAQARALTTLYLGGIQHVDGAVGALLDRVAASPRGSRTAIVIAGDHGEEFMEHGLYGHGHSLYQELVHVPLWIQPPAEWAGGSWRGRQVDEPVSTGQIAETVAPWAGLAPDPAALPGLSAALRGEGVAGAPVRSETRKRGAFTVAVRSGDLKVVRVQKGRRAPRYLTFNLAADPGEARDLGGVDPVLNAMADGFVGELRATPRFSGARVGREEVERLRALGYLDH